MRIDILTVLPEMIEGMVNCSIVKRAQDKGLAEIHLHNLRDYTTNKWRRVDDYPFGGEAGMVMQIEPIDRAISALKSERDYDEVIYTSPDGETFNQPMANSMSMLNNLIILCGHYKGIDYRIREHLITKEISVGDYVLTGGELAAAIITDAVVRLIPGAIGDEQSALSDSFQDNLLAPPVYTRPADYNGWKVPDVLLSGHQRKIEEWRLGQAQERTARLRPDLLKYIVLLLLYHEIIDKLIFIRVIFRSCTIHGIDLFFNRHACDIIAGQRIAECIFGTNIRCIGDIIPIGTGWQILIHLPIEQVQRRNHIKADRLK